MVSIRARRVVAGFGPARSSARLPEARPVCELARLRALALEAFGLTSSSFMPAMGDSSREPGVLIWR
jgi:hypothetical protein